MTIIQVGLGSRGCQWIGALRRAGMQLVACVDPDPRAADWIKGAWPGIPVYQGLEQAIEKGKAQSAIIASPFSQRIADAQRALEAGLAVLIDEPLGPTIDQARALFEAARKARRPLVSC